MKTVLGFMFATPMLYVWGILVGILVLALIRKYPRTKKVAEAGYQAYLEVEKLAKQYGWKGFEKSRPFREALDFILRDQFGIEKPSPKDIAIATESMEKAVANEKKEHL